MIEEEEAADKNEGEEEEKKEELKLKKKSKKAEARVIPIERFPGDDDFNRPEIPYGSIEIIFNTRNAYANRQHHDPSRIYYNIYDP